MTNIKPFLLTEKFFLKLLLSITLILFIAGISTPIMTVTQLVFLQSEFSILSGLIDLIEQQQYFLFAIIFILSVLLPLMKIVLLAWVLQIENSKVKLVKLVNLIHDYGRWAMLDVLVVALLLVTIKLGAIARVEVHLGLYWFAAAVLITMWITHRTVILVKKQ
ncbi:MAG: paraquat-inducible protein A [Oceanospirillaceae bacterium]